MTDVVFPDARFSDICETRTIVHQFMYMCVCSTSVAVSKVPRSVQTMALLWVYVLRGKDEC